MDDTSKNKVRSYGRVMPRVYNHFNRSNLKASSSVLNHKFSATDVGAKCQSNSSIKSVCNDLPVVLNDYVPDTVLKKEVKQTVVVKPKKTLKSLVPTNSHTRTVLNQRKDSNPTRSINVHASAPSVLQSALNDWSELHVKQCFSSRSHTRLKELKDEIKAYQDTEKLMKLRSRLYKRCGVVLNDVGQVAVDKAVQAEETDNITKENRPERGRADAGAAVPHQQMRSAAPRYPVDRYLVESSTKLEMVNITDDELWNPEPAIRPEDEMMLRKLHEMLQSTADDLKLISGELMKCREPKTRVKTAPTPLDEQFNEKVHIEEIVNAKFHGYKIIENPPHNKPLKVEEKKHLNPKSKTPNARVEVRPSVPSTKVPRKKVLAMAPIKFVQIDEKPLNNSKDVILNDAKSKSTPSISYNEFSHTYIEPKRPQLHQKPLHIQEMPSINIRSELREQKVLQLDIVPEQKVCANNVEKANNVAVIALEHETTPGTRKNYASSYPRIVVEAPVSARPTVRRISKMLTCESSESSNNVSSDAKDKRRIQNQTSSNIRTSKPSARCDGRVYKSCKNIFDTERPQNRHIDEWKKKLNIIYGRPTAARHRKAPAKPAPKKPPPKSAAPEENNVRPQNLLNNAEYIPYSKLTLGGIRVTDIEKEISDLPDKNIPLSPILDKILSRENSFHKSPRRKEQGNKNILTTSDENLLEEVLDIERNITSTLSKNVKEIENKSSSRTSNITSENDQSDKAEYADDFEEERSDNARSRSDEDKPKHNPDGVRLQTNNDNVHTNVQNTTYTKSSNLSFKNSVDVFEFVHSIDTQDNATQSITTRKIELKATQTSPRSVQPIRNDLWTAAEPQCQQRHQAFNEDFIKKLIVDECTDILHKNFAKGSEAKDNVGDKKNFAASQKNTQTSPAHVKSSMTSPARTKTRTTSPIVLSLAVDHQTSPITFPEDEGLHIELDKVDDLTVSINLSSPRFSLRLPQTSREVLSNLGAAPAKLGKPGNMPVPKISRKASSSSSADGDYSSSDISSLGEINNEYKRRFRKTKVPAISESSASSVSSKCSTDSSSNILPLKSEGEVSLGQIDRRKLRFSKSDGEVSVGQCRA